MGPTDLEATITPKPGAEECDNPECDADELLALIEPDDVDQSGVYCPTHRVAFLREVTNR